MTLITPHAAPINFFFFLSAHTYIVNTAVRYTHIRTWDIAKTDCNEDPYALPCPGNTPCLDGQLCFAMGLMCTPATLVPTPVPSS